MFRWKVFESSAHKLLPASNHFIYIVYWCRIRAKLLKKRTKNGTRALINELFLPKGTETTKINVENPCCLCIFFFVKVTVGWRHVYASVDDDITTILTRSANENSDYILKPNQNPRKKYQWCCKNTHIISVWNCCNALKGNNEKYAPPKPIRVSKYEKKHRNQL